MRVAGGWGRLGSAAGQVCVLERLVVLVCWGVLRTALLVDGCVLLPRVLLLLNVEV